jgi:predicted dehydrogenase
MADINFGLIGCGGVAQWAHLPSLKSTPGAKLVMVSDVSENAAKRVADPLGIPYTTDYARLLERDDIGAIIVAVPHKFHKQITIDACNSGKHIMCEKPLGMTTSEVDEMITASEKEGVILMTAENYLFDPGVQRIAAFLDQGLLGRVHTVELDEIGDWSIPGSRGFQGLTWNVKRDLAGGGVWISSGVHLTALASRFAGEIAGVTAKTGLYFPEYQGNVADVEDEATAILDHKGGALTTIHVSAISRFPYHNIELHGDKGSVTYHDRSGKPEMKVSGFEAPETTLPSYFPSPESYRNELHHFVDCIAGGKKPLTDAQLGRRALEIVNKGYESAEKKERVSC